MIMNIRQIITKLLVMAAFTLTAASAWAQGPNNTGTYYQTANGKKGEALKTALFNIIKNPDVTSYDGLIEAYKKTDKRLDGTIRDWYSNATKYTWNDRNGNASEGAGWNREHSVPQSWFSKASPMRSDIVHVIPTDCYVNNRRSSYPFGENSGDIYKSANSYSKLGRCTTAGYSGTVFEPNDEIKGDIARIYFYMATCYEDRIGGWASNASASQVFDGNRYPGLKAWTLNMMMRWSKQDPIDAVERARNEAVQEVQGNRNPFVDYPGLEEYVWGDKKGTAFSYDNYNGGPEPGSISEPVISPAGGTFSSQLTVTITCETEGAAIYFTSDETTPTKSTGQWYSQPLTVTESVVLKAVAYKDGMTSGVTTAVFTLVDEPDPKPTDGDVYTRVTTADDLQAGQRYLLVYEESPTLARVLTEVTNGRGNCTDVAVANGEICMAEFTAQPLVLTLEAQGGQYAFRYDDAYVALASNSNSLDTMTEPAEGAQWIVTPQTGETQITNVQYSDRSLRYNPSAKIFRCYSGSQQPVVLYRFSRSSTVDIDKTMAGHQQGDGAQYGAGQLFDLQGRRVADTPAHGIYIQGGRKIVF